MICINLFFQRYGNIKTEQTIVWNIQGLLRLTNQRRDQMYSEYSKSLGKRFLGKAYELHVLSWWRQKKQTGWFLRINDLILKIFFFERLYTGFESYSYGISSPYIYSVYSDMVSIFFYIHWFIIFYFFHLIINHDNYYHS